MTIRNLLDDQQLPEMEAIHDDRRELHRFDTDCVVDVQLGHFFAVHTRPEDAHRGGLRISLPGGATPGERFLIVFAPRVDDSTGVQAEVRWVGQPDEAGMCAVGLRWVDTNEALEDEIEHYLFDELQAA